MKPHIYLAGKIDKNDWRHRLVPGLRGHLWSDGPIDAVGFQYTGPFFVACDHGCNHQPSSHGATAGYALDESTFTRSDVIRNNNAAIDAADLIFAYISSTDCYGTLVELGGVLRSQKRVVIAFAPGIPVDDFWYASHQTKNVHINVNEPRLQGLLNQEIHKYNQHRLLTRQRDKTLLEIIADL